MVDQNNPSDDESLIIPITDESSQNAEEVSAGTVASAPPVEPPAVEAQAVTPSSSVEMTGSSVIPQTMKQTESFVSSEIPITNETSSTVEPPQVAVSGNGNNVSKWFYLIFGITLIVFFAITTLLVLSLTKKSSPTLPAPSSVIVQPTGSNSPAPTSVPPPAVTSVQTNGQNTLNSSDAISDLESDINKTDLSDLDGDLTVLDNQVDTTPL